MSWHVAPYGHTIGSVGVEDEEVEVGGAGKEWSRAEGWLQMLSASCRHASFTSSSVLTWLVMLGIAF